MHRRRFIPLLLLTSCLPVMAGCTTFHAQFSRAAAEIRDDLKLLHPDDDGLDAFGAQAAREIRSMRAELGP